MVPPLPQVSLAATPKLFSPVNLLGRPTEVEARFTTRAAGFWEAQIDNSAGDPVLLVGATVTDGVTPEALVFTGRDGGGAFCPTAPTS